MPIYGEDLLIPRRAGDCRSGRITMWKALEKLVAHFRRKPGMVSILSDDQQVTLSFSGHETQRSFNWRNVDEICAFKRDLFTVDSIRVAICAAGDWYEFAEADVGFTQMVETMNRKFSSIPEGWYTEVMFPPFETNMMTLWKRSDSESKTKN